ncbi:hypothetical protein TrLO_g1608 [Triparma laevis f. longispina]|nr:hypothetical protein TrLO_g1608 [Triparma laevis f. longispina]
MSKLKPTGATESSQAPSPPADTGAPSTLPFSPPDILPNNLSTAAYHDKNDVFKKKLPPPKHTRASASKQKRSIRTPTKTGVTATEGPAELSTSPRTKMTKHTNPPNISARKIKIKIKKKSHPKAKPSLCT